MLLTIRTTERPATDLGYLLHKNPARSQVFPLAFGNAHVFYPEATEEACTAALLLDIDPLRLVRGPGASITDYVNDRAYASSSLMTVAISRVLGSALGGHSKERPELAATRIPLEAQIAAVPCRGGEDLVKRLFGPLGYEVETTPPDGDSRYRNVRLTGTKTVAELLGHIYVLLPVADNRKHYWIGAAETDKLLKHGAGWLEEHPEQRFIVQRYLGHRKHLAEDATERLRQDAAESEEGEDGEESEAPVKREHPRLHDQRLDWVVEALRASGAKTVVDIGCGEGRLLRRLADESQFTKLLGADASPRALGFASRRLKMQKRTEAEREKIRLIQSGLTYADPALAGFDAAAVVEVVEHIDPGRLPAFETAVFGQARPRTIALTTPNREHNVRYEGLADGGLRHRDHRFEWTREEFRAWAAGVAFRHGYTVEIGEIGPEDDEVGAPSQRGLFTQCS